MCNNFWGGTSHQPASPAISPKTAEFFQLISVLHRTVFRAKWSSPERHRKNKFEISEFVVSIFDTLLL